ncbi:MAG TPA: DUF1552 domain-containing protein [Polyangiaceae bacterium]|jgi:hypothetical protein|nr:DUF1552 domain-containing protein [Polyangiaceae bacterium]
MPKIDRLSRRTLLRALGLGPAVLPMLAIEEEARGQVPAAKAALIIAWTNGWMSETAATGWPAPGTTWTFKPFQAALEPYKADLLLLDNMNYRFVRDSTSPENTGHACFPGMLTGELFKAPGTGTSSTVAGGPSIDQYIGSSLVKAGYPGLPSLNLGVFVKSTARLSWRAAGDAVVPATDPYKVFTQVFGSATPAPAGGMPDPTVTRTREMKRSILDNVMADLNRFSGRVGIEDKAKIEAHMESIRAIETDLDRAMVTPSGKPPVLPTGVNTGSTEGFEATTKMMIDISVAALAADATRVVVLQLGDQGDANVILSTLGFKAAGTGDNTGDDNGFHNIAHANGADKDKIDTWFQSQLAYTIAGMKTAGLLDRGVMLAMNSMRHGMHEFNNVPAIMAGNAGGYFKTGRSIKLPDNTANNGILIALANALGVPTQTFGHAAYGGELAVLRG